MLSIHILFITSTYFDWTSFDQVHLPKLTSTHSTMSFKPAICSMSLGVSSLFSTPSIRSLTSPASMGPRYYIEVHSRSSSRSSRYRNILRRPRLPRFILPGRQYTLQSTLSRSLYQRPLLLSQLRDHRHRSLQQL